MDISINCRYWQKLILTECIIGETRLCTNMQLCLVYFPFYMVINKLKQRFFFKSNVLFSGWAEGSFYQRVISCWLWYKCHISDVIFAIMINVLLLIILLIIIILRVVVEALHLYHMWQKLKAIQCWRYLCYMCSNCYKIVFSTDDWQRVIAVWS